ncbi:hypothetical protein D3C79_907430 [compost metagenome]
MSDMNVVSLLERLAANRTKLAGEQEALESNYEPDVKDVRTFLKVLRHLQKRSNNEMATVTLGSDLLEFEITEVVDNDPGLNTSFMDHTKQSRTISFNLPWHLLDVDESELSRDHNGIDGIDKFSAIVLTWFNKLSLAS